MATTYLSLVNSAIVESGTDLDELSSGSFSSTTDSMQKRFKRWVADAWRDIQKQRRNWHFARKDGVYVLHPRVAFYDGSGVDTGLIDGITVSDTNDNWTHTLNGSIVVTDGAFSTNDAAGWFNYKNDTDTYPITKRVRVGDLVESQSVLLEFDVYTGTGAYATEFAVGTEVRYVGSNPEQIIGEVVAVTTNGGNYRVTVEFYSTVDADTYIGYYDGGDAFATLRPSDESSDAQLDTIVDVTEYESSFRIMGYARYSFSENDNSTNSNLSDILEVDLRSFRISPQTGAVGDDYSTTGFGRLSYVTYERWKQLGRDRASKPLGAPTEFTIADDGQYEFNTTPDKEYILSFVYWKSPQILSAHGDTIEGIPDAYTDAIVWKAVQYYADWDNNANMYRKATKRFSEAYRTLLRDYSDEVKFPDGVGDASFLT